MGYGALQEIQSETYLCEGINRVELLKNRGVIVLFYLGLRSVYFPNEMQQSYRIS